MSTSHETPATTPPHRNAAIRLPELAKRLGVCPRTAYTLVSTGAIRTVRAGKCILVPESAIAAFLAGDGEV
jgi:excisionase family DNA binding protein